ncbi:MAG: two-component regulator propeller domain-containing protein, partial [Bacteroidota bacterium]
MTYTPHSIILNVIFLLCFSCQSPKSSEAEENPPVLDPPPSSTPFTTIEHSLTDLHPPRTDTILSFQSRISIIFQDRKGDYWFASQGDGICHYDGTSFTYYDELQGLPRVRAIFEDKDGHICFGVEDGLTIFDGEEFETIRPLPSSLLISNSFSYPKDEDEKLAEANYQQAWKKEGEALWFSAFNKNGVYRYDGEKLRHLTLPVSEDDPDYGARGYHPEHGYDPYAVYGIYPDKNGVLWFGTAGRGLFRYDGKTIVCINKSSKQGVVRAIHQEDSSRIWFG